MHDCADPGWLPLHNEAARGAALRYLCHAPYAAPGHLHPGAAELFYDNRNFRRVSVAPSRITSTLLGKGGVHGLDAEAHRHRKSVLWI